MNQKYEILDIRNKNKWTEKLLSLPISQQDIYYTPEYYELSEINGEGKPFCFVFEKNGEIALYPFLLNSINNLNFNLEKDYYDIQGAYGYNGVISSSLNPDFIMHFHSDFHQFCLEYNIVVEFTRFHTLLENHKFSVDYLSVYKNRVTVFLNLDKSYNEIWLYSYSSVHRNMIRKALKNDIEISILHEKSDYMSFYKMYIETMTNLSAEEKYFFNENYFINFPSILCNNQILLVASYKGEVICSLLLMLYKQFAHYHLSARKKEFSWLPANNLLLDHAVKIAQIHGAKFFHLGGGLDSEGKDSLFKFKSSISKTYKDFYIGGKIHNSKTYQEINTQWENKYPEKMELYHQMFLKYRK